MVRRMYFMLVIVILINGSPKQLIAQEWMFNFALKTQDLRFYNPTFDDLQTIGNRTYELNYFQPNFRKLLSGGLLNYPIVSLKHYNANLYTIVNIQPFEELFQVDISGGRLGDFFEFFRSTGMEYNIGIGKDFYQKKSKISCNLTIGLRQTIFEAKPDSFIPLGSVALPRTHFNYIYNRIQSFKKYQPIWSFSLSGNELRGIHTFLTVGGTIGRAGTKEINNYQTNYFLKVGVKSKGYRLFHLKKKSYF